MRILLSAIYPYIFLLLYLILPFDNYIRALPNILLIILAVAFPLVVKQSDFKKLKSFPVLLFFLLVLFLFLNSTFSGRLGEDIGVIGKVFITLGLAVLYIPVNDVEKIKYAVVFSSLAAIAYSLYHFVLITHDLGYFVLGDSPQVVEALLIDRVYLGMLSVFSILISIQGIKKQYHPLNNYHLGNIIINFVFILLIASRIALVALLILILLRQFYGKRRIWKFVLAGISALALTGFLLVLKNKDNQWLKSDKIPKVVVDFVENSRTYELRTTVWSCAGEVMKKNDIPLNGLGFKTTEAKLVECYAENIENPIKREEFLSLKYNTHNQFLDFYLGAGVLAPVLFIVFILGSLIISRQQYFPTAMIVLLVWYCLVENVFHRQIGSYYIGLIMLAILIAVGMRGEKSRDTSKSESFRY